MSQTAPKVVYECIAYDTVLQDCKTWQVRQDSPPMSDADFNTLVARILLFFVFVFILQQIKKSI